MKRKVKHLFKPNYFIEVGLLLIAFITLFWGSFTNCWWLGIILLGFTQNFAGWIGHS